MLNFHINLNKIKTSTNRYSNIIYEYNSTSNDVTQVLIISIESLFAYFVLLFCKKIKNRNRFSLTALSTPNWGN